MMPFSTTSDDGTARRLKALTAATKNVKAAGRYGCGGELFLERLAANVRMVLASAADTKAWLAC